MVEEIMEDHIARCGGASSQTQLHLIPKAYCFLESFSLKMSGSFLKASL